MISLKNKNREQKKNQNNSKKYQRNLTSLFNAEIIYTNEAFELWFLLHYQYDTSAHSRADYPSLLKKYIIQSYKKNMNIYKILKKIPTSRVQGLLFAINNAQNLRSRNNNQTNPSTNVDILVTELIIRYFRAKKIPINTPLYYP